jgi:hypothetical protein
MAGSAAYGLPDDDSTIKWKQGHFCDVRHDRLVTNFTKQA